MPTYASADAAVHGIELPPGEEVVVTFPTYSRTLEVVITTPGSEPVFWTANGTPALIAGGNCRVIPAHVLASDSIAAKRVYAPGADPGGGDQLQTVAHLISAAAVTLSVQRS